MENLELFLMFLNSIDSNLQLTIQVGGSELWLLDLKLTLKDNKIQTTVYRKPTDSHLYLQVDSCHHLPSILGTQKGVAWRLRKICFQPTRSFYNKSKEYKAYLTGRGHKLKNVVKSFSDAFRKRKTLTVKTKLFFVASIIPWDRISRILFKSKLILLTIVK